MEKSTKAKDIKAPIVLELPSSQVVEETSVVSADASTLSKAKQDVAPKDCDTAASAGTASTSQDVARKDRETGWTAVQKKKKKPSGAQRLKRRLAKKAGGDAQSNPSEGEPNSGGPQRVGGKTGHTGAKSAETRKRPRESEGSTPREIKKKLVEAGRPYSNAVANPLRIAVVPRSYPGDRLNEEQGKLVLRALEREIDEAPDDGYFPSFMDNWFCRGAHVFHCRTVQDGKWLEEKVKGWTPWEGADLMTVKMEDLQKLARVTVYVPGKTEAGTVIKRLSRQNPDLKVNTWRVLGSKEVPSKRKKEEVETAVHVSVERTEVDALKRMDFLPFYGGGRVHCLLWKEKSEGQDGGATDNMEADAPACPANAQEDPKPHLD